MRNNDKRINICVYAIRNKRKKYKGGTPYSKRFNTTVMYKKQPVNRTSLKVNQSYDGERIEEKIERIVNNNEPITDGAPIIYTERDEGVLPQYDIRTDRFEVAVEAMDTVAKSKIAKREQSKKEREEAKVIKLDKDKEAGASEGNPQS